MRNVLADLALESEAATALGLRLAGAVDRGETRAPRAHRHRASASTGLQARRRASLAEALECLGGNGYVEESVLPRLYREAPVNSVWEGSGNVIALDVLRALRRSPGAADALLDEVALARGRDPRLDAFAARLADDVAAALAAAAEEAAWGARSLVVRMALALQAAAARSGTRRPPWRTPSAPPGWPASRGRADPGHAARRYGRRGDPRPARCESGMCRAEARATRSACAPTRRCLDAWLSFTGSRRRGRRPALHHPRAQAAHRPRRRAWSPATCRSSPASTR